MKVSEYYMPTRIISGRGSLSQIGLQVAGVGKKHFLLLEKLL